MFNRFGRGLSARRWPLDEEALLAAAREQTGLDDFGRDDFRRGLRVLLDAIEHESRLTPLGRFLTRRFLVQLLATRLLVQDLIERRPEILEQPVDSPIIIVGLPRSGTTHLHNLMGEDPDLRSLPYWESLEPVLQAASKPRAGRPDPRIKRCARAIGFIEKMMPHFRAMHEMTPDHVHEEIQLLAVDFSTMLFESSYHIPAYRDWYRSTDQTHAYGYMRMMLQVLQSERGGPKRWVLKSPQHLEQIGPLLATFPDAKIVRTHRDPLRVTASICTMITYGNRMNAGAVDPHVIGAYWARRAEDLLRGAVRDADLIPAAQVFDVRFPEFMDDNLSMLERIYSFADQPMTDSLRERMQHYLDTHPPGRYGTVQYRLDDLGIDAEERRDALRFYQERFEIDDE